MRILDRYIMQRFLLLLALAGGIFTGVYVIVDLFENLRNFLDAAVAPGVVVKYYLLKFPEFLYQVTPVAVLLASLLSLGALAQHNEITAMKMASLSHLRIVRPLLLLSLLISVLAWSAEEYLLPPINQQAQNILRTEVKKVPAFRLTKENDIWYRARGDRFLHVGLLDAERGTMRDVTLLELSPTFSLLRRVDAQEGSWQGETWTLHNGYRWDFDREGLPRVERFAELPTNLRDTPEELGRVVKLPGEMSYRELRRYIARLAESGVNTLRYQVDLHAKIATAFVSVIMLILGVSFGLRVGRAGIMIWVGLCIPLAFAYWVFLSLGFPLGRTGVLPPLVAAWLPNAVFALGGLISLSTLRH